MTIKIETAKDAAGNITLWAACAYDRFGLVAYSWSKRSEQAARAGLRRKLERMGDDETKKHA